MGIDNTGGEKAVMQTGTPGKIMAQRTVVQSAPTRPAAVDIRTHVERVRRRNKEARLVDILMALQPVATPDVVRALKNLYATDDISELKEVIQNQFNELEDRLEYAVEWEDANVAPQQKTVKTLSILVDFLLSFLQRI
ncbi:hypothetical protein ACFLW1_02085 [Chloroflexota bacterium]